MEVVGRSERLMEDHYHGFKLSSVCWGYRDIFAQTLEAMFDQGLIGEERPEVTDAFFALLRCSEQQHFDYVLKEFLAAWNPRTSWLFDLPVLFAEVTQLGREFAQSKLHYGITFFRTLGEGGFGQSPSDVQYLIHALRRLRAVDEDLALAFLTGYKNLRERLTDAQLDIYIVQGIRAYHHNKQTGLKFLMGTLRTSELMLQALTQEACLKDLTHSLTGLLRALTGTDVEVGDLGRLDSDELIERGSRVVCLSRWLYLPARIRFFDDAPQNRDWYRLCAVVAAGMLVQGGFPAIHGHPDYPTCRALVGDSILRLNGFQVLEYVRILRGINRAWPGARRLVSFGLRAEARARVPMSAAEQLFFDLMGVGNASEADVLSDLLELVDRAVNTIDLASLLTPDLLERAADAYPGLSRELLRPFAFLPDFLYPGGVSRPPANTLVADLRREARRAQRAREAEEPKQPLVASARTQQETQGETERDQIGIPAAYVYDEWSQEENDYYRDYCHVYERRVEGRGVADLPPDIVTLAQRTRRLFEMLRPDLSKEKFLSDGDTINVDQLLDYLVQHRRTPGIKINFYEKPYHNKRDLAALILLDVSGSTGSTISQQAARMKTIELEKRAALVLGHGLAALGDRFAICGFSGNGREHCEFLVFKDFADPWDRRVIGNVMGAYPRSATRMGAALRHAGYRLGQVVARQRLILLITDGKPMDSGYDAGTGYAQYDVRMACQENLRQGLHTFCISTDDNSPADLELMFPHHRYVILSDVTMLPQLLPRLYLRLTL